MTFYEKVGKALAGADKWPYTYNSLLLNIMKISASIKSSYNQQETVVQTNDSAKEMQITTKPSGFGSSINGGELLLLALATCFCNDIYREATKRNLTVSGVEVLVTGEFGADGEPGSNFTYKASVSSDAPPAEIDALIRHTDQIAEIHNTLRQGLSITLAM
ncbi:OsmC family protein [Spirosoma sp. SC4-14]|uniref:OsmC family protein n=1 Tax=Spirosoma sp. SC4-14 TaxID=3128900 RepID=UPI0030CABF5C